MESAWRSGFRSHWAMYAPTFTAKKNMVVTGTDSHTPPPPPPPIPRCIRGRPPRSAVVADLPVTLPPFRTPPPLRPASLDRGPPLAPLTMSVMKVLIGSMGIFLFFVAGVEVVWILNHARCVVVGLSPRAHVSREADPLAPSPSCAHAQPHSICVPPARRVAGADGEPPFRAHARRDLPPLRPPRPDRRQVHGGVPRRRRPRCRAAPE